MVLPLYPQYSCSTVAAVWDELARILAKSAPFRVSRLFATMPNIRTISMRWRPACALPSLSMGTGSAAALYHGIPQRYANRAMIILSAVAIRRGTGFRAGAAGAGDDDFPVALWPGTG